MKVMALFIGWLVLLALSWPLALLGLVLMPFVWLVWLPIKLLAIVLHATFALLRTVLMLPARLFGYRGA
jgi:hypothetical protein